MVIAPTVEDTAVYECEVTNEAGNQTRSIDFTVHGERTCTFEQLRAVLWQHGYNMFFHMLFCSSYSSSINCRWTDWAYRNQTVPSGHCLYCIWSPRALNPLEQRWYEASSGGTRIQHPAHRSVTKSNISMLIYLYDIDNFNYIFPNSNIFTQVQWRSLQLS